MANPSPRRRVVITGYGMVTPLGKDTDTTFENTAQGRSGVDYITAFEVSGLPCQIGGQIDDGWLGDGGDAQIEDTPLSASRGLRLVRKAAAEAVAHARLGSVSARDRIGFSLGYHADNPSVTDLVTLHRYFNDGRWDPKRLAQEAGYPYTNFFRRKPDMATSLMANLLCCTGPLLTITSACAAGAQAIGESCRMIRDGKADVMIAGGCDSQLNFMGFIGFVLIRALSDKYSSPQTASRPFDRKRNGFVMAEGSGVLILEDIDHARARGVPILGEVLGYGASADAYRITDTHPKGAGAVLAMRSALRDAAIAPEEIDYVNAHGTSTTQNDLTETRAIKEVFGERAYQVPVSSNKSMLGHTIGASGAIEAILTLVGMNRSLILPTINYEFRDPKCDLDYVPNEARVKEHDKSLSNSFGFGGQNACLCIGRYHE